MVFFLLKKGIYLSNEIINILMLGDLIGTPGISEVTLKLSQLKNKEKIHLAIANGENSDNGFGINELNIKSIKTSGVDVITSGNHIWSNESAIKVLDDYDYLLRPANYPKAPGKGWWLGKINEINIGIINLIGRYHMIPVDCPFQTLNKLLKNELKTCQIIIVDFHAESVAEKKALAYDFDGKVSLIAGTHSHVQTADEMILPKGTGYMTDIGMCGGINSVIGMEKEDVVRKMMDQTVIPYNPSSNNTKLQGVIANIDIRTKKTASIKRFSI